jgi:hypothetical protein
MHAHEMHTSVVHIHEMQGHMISEGVILGSFKQVPYGKLFVPFPVLEMESKQPRQER